MKFLTILESIQASGSTNISDALFAGTKILMERDEIMKHRISTLMLITDGLSNAGLSSEETLESLNKLTLPVGCVFNTFGIGEDHDSKLLHSISLKTQGIYYYISSTELIHKIFGGCIQSLLSSTARLVKINFEAHTGSRIIVLATPFQIAEKKKSKDYDINVGLMYSGELKTIVFRLSLNKMEEEVLRHSLLKVKVDYFDIYSNKVETISTQLSIERREYSLESHIPLDLDQNLNRYFAVKAILEAMDLSNRLQFSEAQDRITQCISSITKSSSYNLEDCLNLVDDLKECKLGMMDLNSFQLGMHIAHSYASMYYMERSSGIEIRKRMLNLSGNAYTPNDQDDFFESGKCESLLSKYYKDQ